MGRLETIRAIEDIATNKDCDLFNSATVLRLSDLKTEIGRFRLGSKAYAELYEILEQAMSFDRMECEYVKKGRFLNLTRFFCLEEAEPIVREKLDGFNINSLSDEEAKNVLVDLAGYEPIEKFIELLVKYPTWEPRGSFEKLLNNPKFYSKKEFYSYKSTVMNADIEIIRGTLKWLQGHLQ